VHLKESRAQVNTRPNVRTGFARSAIARVRGWDPITAIAVIVLAFGVVQLIWGAIDIGVTLDEPIHADRLQGWLDTGWYLQPWLLPGGIPNPEFEISNPYVYGPAYAVLGHAANVIAGNEPLGEASTTAGAYAVRHVVTALIALLAVAAAGAATYLLSGSWRIGLWGAAALVAIPRWSGHGFFNPKDIPVASGYTLVTVALVLALWERPGGASRKRRLAIASTLALGIFLAAGTRPAIWPALLVSVLGYAVLRAGQWRFGGVTRPPGLDLAVAAGVAAGAIAIATIYPNAARTPFAFLTESVSGSSSYPWEGVTLTAGKALSEHPPLWYLPAWVGGTVPLLVGVLAIAGVAVALATLVRLLRRTKAAWTDRRLALPLVLAQLLLMPALAIASGSTFYDGMRQHLYLLPAVAILAGIGAGVAWSWARQRSRAWRATLATVLGLALIAPAVQQAILFPYDYTYFNPVARIGGINGRWEADYWFSSVDEAIARVPRHARLMCGGVVSPTDPGDKPVVSPCVGSQFEAFEDRRGTELDADSAASLERPGVWAIAPRRNGLVPSPGCEEAGNVTRRLLGEEVIMSYVLHCDRDAVQIK
jgi:hypothetical protein